MLFTTLLNQISSGNSAKIVHSVDSFDITDVALIDGTQTEYTNETLYFGEYKQLPNGHLPPQCVLVRTAESAALADCPGALALVDAGELFLLVNAAKAAVDASRGQGFYGELMDCAAVGVVASGTGRQSGSRPAGKLRGAAGYGFQNIGAFHGVHH